MKNVYSIVILVILVSHFTACEKIVDLNLESAEPKIVIDASITEGEPCTVILTKSQPFTDNSPFKRISGATIRLSTPGRYTETLQERYEEPGVYISQMKGVVGRTYKLEVLVEDNVYEASSTIPQKVYINDLFIYEIRLGDGSWYSPCIAFDDPPEESNYYYTIVSVNSKILNSYYLTDDKNRNGKLIERILYYNKEDNDDEDLKIGDQIDVVLQTLDKGMYTYYKSLSSIAANGGTNPITNISGGALGCFKAYNPSYMSISIDWSHVRSNK